MIALCRYIYFVKFMTGSCLVHKAGLWNLFMDIFLKCNSWIINENIWIQGIPGNEILK